MITEIHMIKIIYRIAVTALGLILAAHLVPGIEVTELSAALLAAVALGILNAIVRPVLFVLTLPITIVTLGLFMFVINASLFMFATAFVGGYEVDGFLAALLGSLVVSVIGAIGNRFPS